MYCISLQHPAHRLRLSEILTHPFMADKSTHQPPSQETPLPKSQPLIRGAHPFSQASIDSGQYTMSSSQSLKKGGPLRATIRPQGIENHLSPQLYSIASTSSCSHSRHRSTQSSLVDLSNRPAVGLRKTHSMDDLPSSAKPSRSHMATKSPASLRDVERSSGSLKALVPPLNAARLRPIKQQTRNAIVSKVLFKKKCCCLKSL